VSTPIEALLEKRGFLYNHSGDFPQVILIVPSHVPNRDKEQKKGANGMQGKREDTENI
jgi:hypothetical protein